MLFLNCSLKINVLNWFTESSHQGRDPKSVHGAFLIYIIVVPGFIKSKFHEFWKFFFFQTEVLLNNLVSNEFSLILKNEEFFVWLSLSCDTFSSIFFDDISGESIDWGWICFIIVSWKLSGVCIFPFSTVVIVSGKSTQLSIKSCEVSACFFNLSKSDIRLGLEILVAVRVRRWWAGIGLGFFSLFFH